MQRWIWSCLFIICGCGSVKSISNVSPGDDADPGGEGTTDAAGMLKIVTKARFFAAGGPAPGSAQGGVDVVAVQRDGKTIDSTAKTGADGQASLQIHAGGSVTAIYHHPADTGTELVTYFGIQPDDTIAFGQRFTSTKPDNLGTMTFTFPAVNGAINYQVFGPCGNELTGASKLSVTLTELASCHVDPMDIVFVALNAADQVAGYNYLSVNFQAGTSVPIATWTPPKTAMLSVTGLPSEVRGINAVLGNVGNIDQRMFQFLVAGQATGGAYSNSFPWAATAVHTEAQLTVSRTGTFQPIQLLDILPPNVTTWTVASAQFPPWLQAFVVSTADRTGSLFLLGDGAYDAAVVRIAWQHTVAGVQVESHWTFVLPPKMTTFTFPALPADLASVLPPVDDPFITEAHLIEIPSVPDYDALRAIPEASVICPGSLVPDCSLRSGEFTRVVFE